MQQTQFFTKPSRPEILNETAAKIIVTKVSEALSHSNDLTKITCYELTNLVVHGTVEIPEIMQSRVVDGQITISMPIRRNDGKITPFGVSVLNGEFEAVLNFPTAGQYSYTDVEANIDLPAELLLLRQLKLMCCVRSLRSVCHEPNCLRR